jgi:ribonucleoside-diphosphate reductase alpha chain
VDYIFRWLEFTFPGGRAAVASAAPAAAKPKTETVPAAKPPDGSGKRVDEQFQHFMDDAPACDICGAITVRNGACYRCYNCGNSMGCS